MELFEILFILFFILIPVIEGIRKSRQRRDSPDIEEPRSAQPRPRQTSPGQPRRYPEPDAEPEPAEAADMVPDDLWEILTGERRERPTPVGGPGDVIDTYDEPETEEYEAPYQEETLWHEDPAWEREEDPRSRETFDPAPWRGGRSGLEEEPTPFQPEEALLVPTERRARVARPRVSLRDVVQAPRVPRKVSPLLKALQNPDGLRQAVLLREILGPPPGLDP